MRILDTKMQEDDLQDDINFQVMQVYVINLFRGLSLPNPQLISCKEPRATCLGFLELCLAVVMYPSCLEQGKISDFLMD